MYIIIAKQFKDLTKEERERSKFNLPDSYPAHVLQFKTLEDAKREHPEADVLTAEEYARIVNVLEPLKSKRVIEKEKKRKKPWWKF